MGKKSKRQCSKKDATGKTASASTSSNLPADGKPRYPAPPHGASCWICLDEEPDELGQPIMRDCSCRGDSGFGHVSCIVKYAEEKSKGGLIKTIAKFRPTWTQCHCCHQDYRGQLSLTMTDRMISFCEKNYPGDPFIHVEALMYKMGAIGNLDMDQISPKLYRESNDAGLKVISMIGQMKAHNSSLPRRYLIMETNAYLCLGEMHGMMDRPEALKYFEQYRDKSEAIDDEYGVKDAEAHIREEKNRLGILPMDINILRDSYKEKVEAAGEGSPEGIIAGVRLALELYTNFFSIESEKLLSKIVAMSRRVHGLNHQETKFAEKHLQKVIVRHVVKPPEKEVYQFLGYSDSSKKLCNLQSESTGQNTTVETKRLFLALGTPVVCHGLKNASHLNGKMGDLRAFDKNTGRYEIHFEEKNLKPCLVARDNLHIVLDITKEK